MRLAFKYITLAVTLGVISTAALTQSPVQKSVYITIDSDAVSFSRSNFNQTVEYVDSYGDISILKVDVNSIDSLSHEMHHVFNRCGGFMVHENVDEAFELLNSQDGVQKFAKRNSFVNYSINSEDLVLPLLTEVSDARILADMAHLSSYKTRHYKSPEGIEAAKWIAEHWKTIASHRNDVTVELFKHARFDQPSVILTIEGESDEIIIVGGHLDSIAGFWGSSSKAPGADDNASGIATISEIMRVLFNGSFKPQKTIQFIGYAAEEAGLLGSNEIATQYKRDGRNVIGVMQLDMTNYKGTKDLDIVLMRDYTNDDQNKFIGSLLDHYFPEIKWGYDRCGYGCSDHASWHTQGFPASMPFEAKKADMNPHIHSARDTLDSLGNNANHAAKFAKMAIAYIIELDR